MQLHWSKEALVRLEEIEEFIAKDNPLYRNRIYR